MPKYKQAAMAIAFLTILFSAGICTGFTDNTGTHNKQENASLEEAILQAFEDSDYESWKKIVAKNKDIGKVISESRFQDFITARQAARSGNYDQAIAISMKLEQEIKKDLGDIYLA